MSPELIGVRILERLNKDKLEEGEVGQQKTSECSLFKT